MKLGVNIDHVATLRQVRGTAYPDPLEAARLCAEAGAHSLTVHLREDRRHIQDRDVAALSEARILPLNLEMGNAPEIVRIALDTKPEEACLVPERRRELTTEGGLDVAGQLPQLRKTVDALRGAGVLVSLFVEPDPRQIQAAAELKVPYVELHTGSYCEATGPKAKQELDRLIAGAGEAHRLGLKVNAGHGINLSNIDGILRMPHLDTLNIGHSIIARAVFVGMKAAVAEMLCAMAKYRGGES
ncbi:MAG: pyridoxine 5'-phosphate synthase [bacterium]